MTEAAQSGDGRGAGERVHLSQVGSAAEASSHDDLTRSGEGGRSHMDTVGVSV